VLLLGSPAWALAGPERGPDKPPHQCEDGIDNDGDTLADYEEDGSGDPDCGSPRDNSEGPDDAPEEPGGETPEPPSLPGLPELPSLPPELPVPPGGGELPELPVPPGGGEPPALPEPPAGPPSAEQIEAVVTEVLGQLPAPPQG
jgi:hypothetical protein